MELLYNQMSELDFKITLAYAKVIHLTNELNIYEYENPKEVFIYNEAWKKLNLSGWDPMLTCTSKQQKLFEIISNCNYYHCAKEPLAEAELEFNDLRRQRSELEPKN
jgi:hypothetical protein